MAAAVVGCLKLQSPSSGRGDDPSLSEIRVITIDSIKVALVAQHHVFVVVALSSLSSLASHGTSFHVASSLNSAVSLNV